MIDLTPLEVRKKKGDFRRQMRGYDPASVDDFLDLVADRLEQLVRESLTMQERVSVLEAQVADYRDREKALTEALVTAQEMRDEIRRQVAKEAELSRREAEAQSDSIRSAAVHAREKEEEAIRRLRARQLQLVQSYRSFLERELAELSVMAETLEVQRTRPMFPEIEALPEEREAEAEAARTPPAAATPAPTTKAAAAAEERKPAKTKRSAEVSEVIEDEVTTEPETAWVSTLIERKG